MLSIEEFGMLRTCIETEMTVFNVMAAHGLNTSPQRASLAALAVKIDVQMAAQAAVKEASKPEAAK